MLILERVHKSFYDPGRGEVRAVDGVDICLDAGVVALVGANGAGKSTLLRLCATLLRPDSGRVVLNGLDTRSHAARVRARLGYLSTTTRLYPRFTPLELLRFVGGFFPLEPAQFDLRLKQMIERFALDEFLNQRMSGLSTGQLQRVNLARTLLPDPELLILDEPTTGLDVLAAHQVSEAIRSSARPGRLIILATHIMRDVEQLADRVLVMRQGRLVHDGPPSSLGSGERLHESIHRLLVGSGSSAGPVDAPAGAP
ncbi:MAG: ABC transporter ATP-binding protein [Planctomycetes bacterium]|nr:ABC transporter ATP-binding protein [Planctomycetota bacterium]